MGAFEHVKPLDQPIDEGTGGAGDRRIRAAMDDETGGAPQDIPPSTFKETAMDDVRNQPGAGR